MFWNYLKYTFKKDKKILFIAFLLLLIAFGWFIKMYTGKYDITVWTDVIDPVVTLLTVSITLLVYFTNAKIDWENNLTKVLTVHFVYQDKYVMTCYQSFLSGESDIRQWGQQIGSQMASEIQGETVRLNFYPYITLRNEIINPTTKEYILNIYLSKINDKCRKNYIVWIDNNDNSPENIELVCGEHPNKPYTIEQAISIHNSIEGNKKIISQNGQYSIQYITSNV